jgi:hypothetical protein
MKQLLDKTYSSFRELATAVDDWGIRDWWLARRAAGYYFSRAVIPWQFAKLRNRHIHLP